MITIKITDDLILEIHDGDPPALHLYNPGNDDAAIIWPDEIRHLRDALAEAAGVVTGIVEIIEHPVTTAADV